MGHLDLKLLRSFAAVAEELSVTRAAARLHLTQPTVSGQIKELEHALGFVLFHRTTRQVVLSEQGARLLPLVRAVLDRAEDVRREVEAIELEAATRFRLGAAMYSLDFDDRIALLDGFAAAFPDLHYAIDNRLQTDQIADLLHDRLDAALLLGISAKTDAQAPSRARQPGEIHNEVQYPDSLSRVVLRRRRIGLLVPEASPLALQDIIPRAALAGQCVAMLGAEHGGAFINPLMDFLAQCDARPLVPSEGNALAVERFAQRNGMCAIGIGWFPPGAGMILRPVEAMDFHLDFAVVLGCGANRAARRFFDFACAWQAGRDAQGIGGIADADGGARFSALAIDRSGRQRPSRDNKQTFGLAI